MQKYTPDLSKSYDLKRDMVMSCAIILHIVPE